MRTAMIAAAVMFTGGMAMGATPPLKTPAPSTQPAAKATEPGTKGTGHHKHAKKHHHKHAPKPAAK